MLFIIFVISTKQVQERLKPHLPEGSEALSSLTTELQQTVRSPHFKQAMQSFASAMATGQLGPVLAQFGLPQQAQDAANKGGWLSHVLICGKVQEKKNADK